MLCGRALELSLRPHAQVHSALPDWLDLSLERSLGQGRYFRYGATARTIGRPLSLPQGTVTQRPAIAPTALETLQGIPAVQTQPPWSGCTLKPKGECAELSWVTSFLGGAAVVAEWCIRMCRPQSEVLRLTA